MAKMNRREFVKQTVAGTAVLASASAGALETVAAAGPTNPNKQVVAALGALFIPSKAGDPGYSELEPYGISDFVLSGGRSDPDEEADPLATGASVSIEVFPVEGIPAFNSAAQQFFDGKTFLNLDAKQQEEYLKLIIDGSKISDAGSRRACRCFIAGRGRVSFRCTTGTFRRTSRSAMPMGSRYCIPEIRTRSPTPMCGKTRNW